MGNCFPCLSGHSHKILHGENCKKACPEIEIEVLFELPGGTSDRRRILVDISKTTSNFKNDLSRLFHVESKDIDLTVRNKMLEDNKTLHEQGLEGGNIMVMQDRSLDYHQ